MSLLNSKTFLAGVLLAITFAMTGSAMALEGARLWKPYQPEEFGGSRRSGDGLYGELSAVIWRLDGPRDSTRLGGSAKAGSTKLINTAMDAEIEPDFQIGTKLVVGNQQGHHGWRFSGVGLSGLGGSVQKNGTLDWSERGLPQLISYCGEDDHLVYEDPFGNIVGHPIYENWMNVREVGSLVYGSRSNLIDLALSYNYRPHPFSWGELDFSVGARFRDLKDTLYYSDKATSNLYVYTYSICPDYTDTTEGAVQVEYTYNQSRQARNRMIGPDIGFELSRRNRRWTFSVGPSVFLGVNAQSFTFNEYSKAQMATNNTTSGGSGSSRGNSGASSLQVSDLIALQNADGSQLINLGNTTRYKTHRTVFSPGVSLDLSAKWQWTDAVGIKFGFNSTVMNNMARGSDLVADPHMVDAFDSNNKPILKEDGSQAQRQEGYDYSLRSKGTTMLLYGVSIGLEVRR